MHNRSEDSPYMAYYEYRKRIIAAIRIDRCTNSSICSGWTQSSQKLSVLLLAASSLNKRVSSSSKFIERIAQVASNVSSDLLLAGQVCLQCLSELVADQRWIMEIVRPSGQQQKTPDDRTCCDGAVVAASRTKTLTTGNIRCESAAVHKVLRSFFLEMAMDSHCELVLASFWNVQPVHWE